VLSGRDGFDLKFGLTHNRGAAAAKHARGWEDRMPQRAPSAVSLETAERQFDRIQAFFPRIDSKVSSIFAIAISRSEESRIPKALQSYSISGVVVEGGMP
jgi:hypothetical protein